MKKIRKKKRKSRTKKTKTGSYRSSTSLFTLSSSPTIPFKAISEKRFSILDRFLKRTLAQRLKERIENPW